MKHVRQTMASANQKVRTFIKNQRGVTGLETAIILIAFVVVASVFAFTVLSTGIFSAERGKETIHAGLKEARSSIEVKGSVFANGVTDKTLSLANASWSTTSTDVTVTADTSDKKEGTGSADLVIAVAYTTGVAAYENLSPSVDLTNIDSIRLWIKSSVATGAGDLRLRLSSTSTCTVATSEDIQLPALTAATWKRADVAIADATNRTVACVGLVVNTDNGAQTVNLDQIIGRGQATTLVVTLANALQGKPVDLTAPSDSDDDGLSDSDSKHSMILTFTDENQLVRDAYWTKTYIGDNDGDDLLEAGERAELTVELKGLANATTLVKNVEFDLEIRPEEGGVVVIERTMPDNIDAVMNLN